MKFNNGYLLLLLIPFLFTISNAYAMKATGGTITYDGSYTVHSFTTSGTFTVTNSSNNTCLVLVVGGGGGGAGSHTGNLGSGGGGGAGEYAYNSSFSCVTSSITIGAGGSQVSQNSQGNNGTNSIYSSITAKGGGGGGLDVGKNGGSGGGGAGFSTGGAGGSHSGSYTGTSGGTGESRATAGAGAGGGGAGVAGENGGTDGAQFGGDGGNGLSNSISGSSITYAGGGGGGEVSTPSTGGTGGGGNGGVGGTTKPTNGTANTGGGGGGGGSGGTGSFNIGAKGGSGIVIISYLTVINPPTNFSCTSEPYSYNCSWTGQQTVTNYNWQKSTNNSTWVNGATIGNITSATFSGFGVNSANYLRINATFGGGYGSSSNVVFATTDNYPDSPSISITPNTKTDVDIDRVAGASNGGDTITNYDLRCEKNRTGGWITLVTNGTITTTYNYPGLSGGDYLSCQWRDRNGVGYSSWSANATGYTITTTSGTLSYTYTNVGDIFLLNGTLSNTIVSPSPQTVTTIRVIDNGTLIKTTTPNDSIIVGSNSLTFVPIQITDDLVHSIYLSITATNDTGTVTINSTSQNLTRDYAPSYEQAVTASEGDVYWIATRSGGDITLITNRDKAGNAFQMECAFYNNDQARLGEHGIPTWKNFTNIYYYYSTVTMSSTQTVYYKCYNSNLLFQSFIPVNGTGALVGGFESLDGVIGNWMGVPIATLFILFLASMATKTNSTITTIAIMIAIGIMGGIGLFTMDAGLWALIMIMGTLGIVSAKLGFD